MWFLSSGTNTVQDCCNLTTTKAVWFKASYLSYKDTHFMETFLWQRMYAIYCKIRFTATNHYMYSLDISVITVVIGEFSPYSTFLYLPVSRKGSSMNWLLLITAVSPSNSRVSLTISKRSLPVTTQVIVSVSPSKMSPAGSNVSSRLLGAARTAVTPATGTIGIRSCYHKLMSLA